MWLLSFKGLSKSYHSGRDLARVVKTITDGYNITFKISRFIVDSVSNNLSFADEYYDLIMSDIEASPFAEELKKGFVFKGRESLVRVQVISFTIRSVPLLRISVKFYFRVTKLYIKKLPKSLRKNRRKLNG